MADSKTLYRINESKQQARLADLAEHGGDTADLRAEIILARAMLQTAIDNGNQLFANQLLQTLTKLTRTQEQMLYRSHQLLEKAVVMKLVGQIVDVFTNEFLGVCQDSEERIDRAARQLTEVVSTAENKEGLL